MLLFPNGRPPSPRWRWVLRAGLGMGAFFLFFGLFPLSFTLTEQDNWTITNPIGFLPADIEPLVSVLWSVPLITLILLCAAAPFVRFRRAAGVEREQIKWLFYSGGLFALLFLAELLLGIFGFLLVYTLNEEEHIELHMKPRFVALFPLYLLWLSAPCGRSSNLPWMVSSD